MFVSPLQLGDVLVLASFAALGLAVLGFGGLLLYLEHRTEMALIETGQYAEARSDSRAWVLGGGLVLLALGLANVVTTLLAGGTPEEGVAAAFLGLAALAYYLYRRREERTDADAANRA
jgi:hypothetical protein